MTKIDARAWTVLIVCASLLAAGCATSNTVVTVEEVEPAPRDFDYGDFRRASAEISRIDAGGRVRQVTWEDDGTLSFTRDGERLGFDPEARAWTDGQPFVEAPRERGRGGGRRPARGRQRTSEPSPDGRWIAVCRDWNVVLEPVGDDDDEATDDVLEGKGPAARRAPIAVTTDGTRKHRYGTASWVYGEELGQSTALWWSPDSRKLVYYVFDEEDVPDFLLLSGLTDRRPALEREGYPKPGEPNPRAGLVIHDVETGAKTTIDTKPDEDGDEWYVYAVRFTPDGTGVIFNRTNRHQSVLHVEVADLETGAARRIVTETQETWQDNAPRMRFLEDGARFIWETERSGVKQYELRHLDGRRLNGLTDAPGPVVRIDRLDEAAGVLYFSAYGGTHPLDVHLYRVNLDGTDQRRLTREPGAHRAQFDPSGRWFITQYESIERPPATALYAADGTRLATLAEGDLARVTGAGYPEPELFECLAADGETTLYGWLYKPRGFDPSKRYPLLIDVYGGPESKGVTQRFRASHAGCALGVLVAKIDNRGTGGRGKAFMGAVYEKLGTVDLDDQVAGVRHLLERPYVDASRVGIYGHSYGGYMAALAAVRYPDVFRAASAGAPVTDWRNYDTIYTERYMRTPEENADGYDAGSCMTYADDLEDGALLILHGMVDDNVHPTNSWQLIDKLQDAGTSFETMFYPNSGHGLRAHSSRVRWEFLHRRLVEE